MVLFFTAKISYVWKFGGHLLHRKPLFDDCKAEAEKMEPWGEWVSAEARIEGQMNWCLNPISTTFTSYVNLAHSFASLSHGLLIYKLKI